MLPGDACARMVATGQRATATWMDACPPLAPFAIR
jgi:hypothetical protein